MARKSKLDHNDWYGSHGARLTYEQAKDAGYPYNRGVYKMTRLHWIRGQVARGLMSSDEAQEMLEERSGPAPGDAAETPEPAEEQASAVRPPVSPGAAMFPDTVPLDSEEREEEEGQNGEANGKGNGQAHAVSGRAVPAGDGAPVTTKSTPAGRLADNLAIELPRVRILPEVVALYNGLRERFEISETFEEWLNLSVIMAWRAQGMRVGLMVEEG